MILVEAFVILLGLEVLGSLHGELWHSVGHFIASHRDCQSVSLKSVTTRGQGGRIAVLKHRLQSP